MRTSWREHYYQPIAKEMTLVLTLYGAWEARKSALEQAKQLDSDGWYYHGGGHIMLNGCDVRMPGRNVLEAIGAHMLSASEGLTLWAERMWIEVVKVECGPDVTMTWHESGPRGPMCILSTGQTFYMAKIKPTHRPPEPPEPAQPDPLT